MPADLFHNPAAFRALERPVEVEYALAGETAGAVRRATVRASWVQGGNLSNGAGAPTASETGNRLSVVIRSTCWPAGEPPSVGTRFLLPSPLGPYICKHVQPWRYGWTLRCTQDMRGGELT